MLAAQISLSKMSTSLDAVPLTTVAFCYDSISIRFSRERERGKETFVIVPFDARLNDRLFRIILSFRDTLTLFRKFHIFLASTSFYFFIDSHIFSIDNSRDNIPLKYVILVIFQLDWNLPFTHYYKLEILIKEGDKFLENCL